MAAKIKTYLFNGPGRHIDDDPNAPPMKVGDGFVKPEKSYKPGEKIRTHKDLLKFNSDGQPPRFTLLDEGKEVVSAPKVKGTKTASPAVSDEDKDEDLVPADPLPEDEDNAVTEEDLGIVSHSEPDEGDDDEEEEEEEEEKKPDFYMMTLPQLKNYAKGKGINCHNLRTKDQVIAKLKAHL